MADLRLAISVDSSGAVTAIKTFNSEVEKSPAAASKASAAVGGLQKVFSDFTSSIAGGLGIGAGFAVGQKAADALFASFGVLTGGVRALTDQFEKGMGLLLGYSDQIVTLNQRTGLTTSVLQVLGAMAKTGGTGLEFLSGAVVKMELAINKGSDAFKKLGLDIVQMKALSPDAAFEKVATAVSGIVDPMQRAAAAVAIFGKAGAEMLPVLTAKMAEAREQAEAFGIVMQDKTLRASEALGDQLDLTKMAFDAFLMRVAGVVAESPALAAILDQLGLGFGRLSKAIEDNAPALTKWVDIGILGAVKAIETLLAALQKGMRMLEMFGGIAGTVFGFGAELTGLNQMIQKMKEFTQETQKAVLERASLAAWAAKNKGALNLPKAGGGPTFDGGGGSGKVEIKVAELKVPDLPNLWMNLFGGGAQGKFGTLQGGSKNYNLWGDKSKFLPPELDGNTHVGSDGGNKAITASSFSASQALQNLANIAQLSGSKLAKGLAGIFGGSAGIASGVQGLSALSGVKGLTGVLGKLGAWGSIASSALSIGSSIFGLFKKKPKEPPPEPPKQASAKAWADFTGEQQSKGASGLLAGVSGILPTSPEAMADQASIALGAYWAMWKTKGPMAAAEAFAPIRDKMMETFKAAGASDTDIAAMLGGMSSQIDLAQNKAFGGAAEGMNGYAQALASIANQQMPMTIDQFRAFERQAVAGYEQMKQAALDQGMSAEDAMKNALMSSGQFLTTLKDAAAKYGFDLGGSQALFDDASKAGVAFGASSEDRLIMSLDALTETLGGAPPKFQQAIAAGAAGASGGLRGERSGDGSGIQESAEKTGDATAAALAPNLAEQTAALIAGFADALKNLPTPAIVLGDGAIAGAVIRDINAGNGGVATALDGRG